MPGHPCHNHSDGVDSSCLCLLCPPSRADLRLNLCFQVLELRLELLIALGGLLLALLQGLESKRRTELSRTVALRGVNSARFAGAILNADYTEVPVA